MVLCSDVANVHFANLSFKSITEVLRIPNSLLVSALLLLNNRDSAKKQDHFKLFFSFESLMQLNESIYYRLGDAK